MNQQDTLEIAQLIHHEWSEAMKIKDIIKNETDDGSPDWKYFHESRTKLNAERIEKFDRLGKVFREEHPLEFI